VTGLPLRMEPMISKEACIARKQDNRGMASGEREKGIGLGFKLNVFRLNENSAGLELNPRKVRSSSEDDYSSNGQSLVPR